MPRFSVWSQQQLTKVTSLNADDAFVLATDTPEAKAIEVEDLASEIGIPTAGFTGQVLAKASGSNYDTAWQNRATEGGLLTVADSLAANYPTASHQAGLAITGDIDVRVRCALDSVTAFRVFTSKESAASQRCWSFLNTNNNRPLLRWFSDGTAASIRTATGNAAFSAGANQTQWFRVTLDVDNGAGGYDVKYFEAPDQPNDPTAWVQVGTTVTGGVTTSIFAGTDPLTVGLGIGASVASGGVYRRMIVRNGIDGSVVADWQSDIPTIRYNDGLGNTFVITGSAYAWTK